MEAPNKIVYNCEVCYKQLSTKGNLKTHMKTHNEEREEHACEQCDKKYKSKGALDHHMSAVHESSLNMRKCPKCDYKTADKSGLQSHLRTHINERPFACHYCDKRFTTSSNLIVHARLHTGEKPYQCQTCDKAFAQQGNLQQHMIIHDRVKPHACDHCDKRFTQSSNLKVHMRTQHTGKKSYHGNENTITTDDDSVAVGKDNSSTQVDDNNMGIPSPTSTPANSETFTTITAQPSCVPLATTASNSQEMSTFCGKEDYCENLQVVFPLDSHNLFFDKKYYFEVKQEDLD